MNHGCSLKYSKTCVKWPLSKRQNIGFQDQVSLNAGQSIAECSSGSILHYFQPSLSYHLSLSIFECHFILVLLYFAYCNSQGLKLVLLKFINSNSFLIKQVRGHLFSLKSILILFAVTNAGKYTIYPGL